jgi:hypothetical protein
MGSLTGRLNSVSEENVSWRMSHEAAIINNPMGNGVKDIRTRGFEYYGEDIVKPYTDVP